MIKSGKVTVVNTGNERGNHLTAIANKWKELNKEGKAPYYAQYEDLKRNWEAQYGPVSEYKRYRKQILKRKRDSKKNKSSSRPAKGSKHASSSSSSSSSSAMPNTDLWLTPVTARQRRWVNRPATEALEARVFGVYPLQDVEHMCRIIWTCVSASNSVAIDWQEIANKLKDSSKWTPHECRVLWKYAAYGIDASGDHIDDGVGSIGNIGNIGDGGGLQLEASVLEEVSDDDEIAASVGTGMDPPSFITERRQTLKLVRDEKEKQKQRLLREAMLQKQKQQLFREQQVVAQEQAQQGGALGLSQDVVQQVDGLHVPLLVPFQGLLQIPLIVPGVLQVPPLIQPAPSMEAVHSMESTQSMQPIEPMHSMSIQSSTQSMESMPIGLPIPIPMPMPITNDNTYHDTTTLLELN